MLLILKHTLLPIVLMSALLLPAGSSAQQQQDSSTRPPVNRVDAQGLRTGFWWEDRPALRGESAYTAFGTYTEGRRSGKWYKLNNMGDLIAIEHFRFGLLHGEVQYFEGGRLVCIGHYRGLNPSADYDSILITHPVTGVQEFVGIRTERGSLRHGSWKYFDPENGRLIREEEYQVDELLSRRDHPAPPADSIRGRSPEVLHPHDRSGHYKLPKGKTGSKIR